MIDAFNQSRIIASNAFNLSAVTIVAILFVLITIPQARFVDRLIERDNARMQGGGLTWHFSKCSKVEKDFGPIQVLRGVNLEVERASGGLPHRPFGLRKVDAAALHQRA